MSGKVTTWVVVTALLLAGGSACAAPASGGSEGAHTLRGEVTTIDEARGMVTVKVPAAGLKGFKKGDHVTVRLVGEHAAGVERKPAAKASAGEETKAAPMSKGR